MTLPPAGKPPAGRPHQSAQPAVPAHLRPVPGHVPAAPAPLAATTLTKPKRPALTTLTRSQRRTPTPAEEVAFTTVEVEMGGRQKFVSTLLTAQLPADVDRVLGAIADPANDGLSLAKICAGHRVSLAKLLEVFQSALRARGQLQARVTIAHHLPDVAAGVMKDAVAGDRVCPECLGAASPEGKDPCAKCKGKGMVRHVPNHEVVKTALKIGGLLETGKGVSIAVNQQTLHVGGGADAASYDTLIAALDGALYGKGRARLQPDATDTLDGEVLHGDDQDGPVA